eukprot:COSAG02_NODE_901_length_16056_cov_52.549477_7_plen_172_part_00
MGLQGIGNVAAINAIVVDGLTACDDGLRLLCAGMQVCSSCAGSQVRARDDSSPPAGRPLFCTRLTLATGEGDDCGGESVTLLRARRTLAYTDAPWRLLVCAGHTGRPRGPLLVGRFEGNRQRLHGRVRIRVRRCRARYQHSHHEHRTRCIVVPGSSPRCPLRRLPSLKATL